MSGRAIYELIVGPITCFSLDKERKNSAKRPCNVARNDAKCRKDAPPLSTNTRRLSQETAKKPFSLNSRLKDPWTAAMFLFCFPRCPVCYNMTYKSHRAAERRRRIGAYKVEI